VQLLQSISPWCTVNGKGNLPRAGTFGEFPGQYPAGWANRLPGVKQLTDVIVAALAQNGCSSLRESANAFALGTCQMNCGTSRTTPSNDGELT